MAAISIFEELMEKKCVEISKYPLELHESKGNGSFIDILCPVPHRHGQRCGNWLWEQRLGWAEEGKMETTVTEK